MNMKVFWPDDLDVDIQGLLYGWRLEDDWIVVAGVSQSQTKLLDTGDERGPHFLTHIHQREVSPASRQYITYKPPNTDRLRFFALHPTNPHPEAQHTPRPGYSASNHLHRLYDQYLAGAGGAHPESHLEETLVLINTVQRVRRRVELLDKDVCVMAPMIDGGTGAIGSPQRDSTMTSFTSLDAVSKMVDTVARLVKFRGCGSLIHAESCAIAKQTMRRTRELRDLPGEWLALRGKDITLEEKSRRYINFYNTVWLVANDLILGWTISSILREQFTRVEYVVEWTLQQLFTANIVDGLRWLDDWPVGLKLNTPLSRLFCETYIGMTSLWQLIISCLPVTPSVIVWSLIYLSIFGVSMFISALSDMTTLATLHLRFATRLSGAIYRAEMASLYTLWNLFRGKRWNSLRKRVDSFEYEIDQLFLGTLLFTIALFLLPTIATYYLFFAIIRLSLLYLQEANDTALAFINSFPLFALMLRLKEPSRLPGGVSFQLEYTKAGRAYLRLASTPIGTGLIFGKFVSDWHNLSVGYAPFALLKRLVRGTL